MATNNESFYEDEVVEFFMSKPNERGTLRKKTADGEYTMTVPFNVSKRYPAFCVIKDDRKDSPTFGKPITIRYMDGEPFIYVDKQSQPWDLEKYKLGKIKLPSIYFIEFLRKCRWNEKNAAQYNYKDKTFFEFNAEDVAEKYIEDTDRTFELEYKARNVSWDKGNAILRVSGTIRHIGEITKMSPKQTKFYLIDLVKKDADKFEKVFNDHYLQTKYDILTALDTNNLKWTGAYNTTLVDTTRGEVICNAPQGDDKLQFAASYLFDRSPETYSYIRKMIGRGEATSAGKGTDSTDPRDIIANGTKEQIVDAIIAWHRDTSIEDKVFDVKGPDIRFNGVVLSDPFGNTKGYNAVKVHLMEDSNEETFNAVFNLWVKQVNSKK